MAMKLFSKYTLSHIRCINVRMFQNISLIWLNSNVNENIPNHQNTIAQLRRTVNTIETFTDRTKCIKFLENIGDKKTCMIISGSSGQQIVPQIHNLAQVDTIFILSRDKQFQETWTKNWSKIKGVFTEIEPLCDALKNSGQQYEQDSISMSFIKMNDVSSKDQLERLFMYSTVLKDILLTTKFNDQQIQEYIDYCRYIFKDNDQELKNVEKFEQERTKKSPIWWYTYDCFLYPMLNHGLRLLDGDIILKMGFFIADLHRQIEELHKEQFRSGQSNAELIVYRGQGMSKTKFEKLQQTKGGLLSFNNFLSTNKKQEVSMNLAHNGARNPENVGILFVMTIPPDQSTTPFASIAHINNHDSGEDEILFGMHSIFRINDIQPMSDHPSVFKVDLSLTTDNDKDLQTLTNQIRQETFPNSIGWYRLILMLEKERQFGKAQQVYEMLLQQETVVNRKAHIYHKLASMKNQQGEYQEAIRFYEKALEIYQQSLPPNHSDLASSYNNIGIAHRNIGDYTKALSNHQKALEIQQQSLPFNHPHLASSYNNIGIAHRNMGDYTKALSNHQKALEIRRQSFPSMHPDLAQSYNNIGIVYYSLGEYTKAFSHFEKALAINQQSFPSKHPDLAGYYSNIGTVYGKMGDYTKALSNHQKALEIQQQSLPPNHSDLASLYNNIGNVYSGMGEYAKALSNFETGIEIWQQSLPPNHPHLASSYNSMGIVYKNMGEYEKALSNYKKALAIQQQSLPVNHPDLAMTYGNLALTYEKLKNYSRACSFIEKSVDIAQKTLPPNHPYRKEYQNVFNRIKNKT